MNLNGWFYRACIKTIDRFYPHFHKCLNEETDGKESLLLQVLYRLLFFALLAAVTICILDIWFSNSGAGSASDFDHGQFGDFFGGVLNPIFTFLTFIGLIFTIVIQRQELRLARTEFKKTSEALQLQAFESTFFSLIDLHHKIIENLSLNIFGFHARLTDLQRTKRELKREFKNGNGEKAIFLKREAFDAFVEYLAGDKFFFSGSASLRFFSVVDLYKDSVVHNNNIFGHYFRNLYQILKIIDELDEKRFSFDEKIKYARVLRAQLSATELALLFINCLDGVCDGGQFKNLLIQYHMLEHLPLQKSSSKVYKVNGTNLYIDHEYLCQYRVVSKVSRECPAVFGGAFGKNLKIDISDFDA